MTISEARKVLGLREGDENMGGLLSYEENLKYRMQFASAKLVKELEREMNAVQVLKASLEAEEEDAKWERYFDAVKEDVAYCLGLEEDSEEWYELMAI